MSNSKVIKELSNALIVREGVIKRSFRMLENSFKVTINEQELVDIIVYQIRNNPIKPDDIFGFINRVAPIAAMAGCTYDEFIALLSLVTNDYNIPRD